VYQFSGECFRIRELGGQLGSFVKLLGVEHMCLADRFEEVGGGGDRHETFSEE
jgi:hypothetical protein